VRWVAAGGVSPRLELVFSGGVDDLATAGLEGFRDAVEHRPHERGEETEDKDRQGFRDAIDESFEPGDLLNDR
jgi:hypothetical protein